MSILCLVMLVLCVYILTAIWLFATSSAFFCFGNPAVLYIGIVESRQRSRAAVQSLWE